MPELLSCDLQSERGAQTTIKDGIAACETARDDVSRDLLRKILDDTEDHIDWLETQIELLARVELENYLQSQIGGRRHVDHLGPDILVFVNSVKMLKVRIKGA